MTWLTPEFYQTHKLRNLLRDTMSATIQCYTYLGSDTSHYEQFDCVSERDHALYHFRPKSDFKYNEMLEKVEQEYSKRQRTGIRGILAGIRLPETAPTFYV